MPRRSCKTCHHVCRDDCGAEVLYECRYHPPTAHVNLNFPRMGFRVPEDGWCGQWESSFPKHPSWDKAGELTVSGGAPWSGEGSDG